MFTQHSILIVRSGRDGKGKDPAKSTRTTHNPLGIIEAKCLVTSYMLDAGWGITKDGSRLSGIPHLANFQYKNPVPAGTK